MFVSILILMVSLITLNSEAQKALKYLLADNVTLTVAQVQTAATDTTFQSLVDGIVEVLVAALSSE